MDPIESLTLATLTESNLIKYYTMEYVCYTAARLKPLKAL